MYKFISSCPITQRFHPALNFLCWHKGFCFCQADQLLTSYWWLATAHLLSAISKSCQVPRECWHSIADAGAVSGSTAKPTCWNLTSIMGQAQQCKLLVCKCTCVDVLVVLHGLAQCAELCLLNYVQGFLVSVWYGHALDPCWLVFLTLLGYKSRQLQDYLNCSSWTCLPLSLVKEGEQLHYCAHVVSLTHYLCIHIDVSHTVACRASLWLLHHAA